MTLLLMIAGLFGLILINVPIAVALGVVAVVAMIATQGPAILPNMALVMYDGATNFPLLAIPMFILAGAIMNATGISQRLIALASACLGFIAAVRCCAAVDASCGAGHILCEVMVYAPPNSRGQNNANATEPA